MGSGFWLGLIIGWGISGIASQAAPDILEALKASQPLLQVGVIMFVLLASINTGE